MEKWQTTRVLQDGDNPDLEAACSLGCQAAALSKASVIAVATEQEEFGAVPLGVIIHGKYSDVVGLIAHTIVAIAETSEPDAGKLTYKKAARITSAVTRAIWAIADDMIEEGEDDGSGQIY